MQRHAFGFILLVFVALGIGSCGDGGGAGTDPGILRINVDPVQFEGLTAMSLEVSRIEVVITPDLVEEGHILELSTTPRTLNLIGFSGLTPKLFGEFRVPEDGYITQIRFIVEDGSASRGPETEPVTVPSSPQTGVKMISADQTVEIKDTFTTDVTISLDPEASVIENIGKGILLKPVTKLELGAVTALPVNQFIPDRITVLFENDASEEEINAIIDNLGASVISKSLYSPYYVLELPADSDVLAIQNSLKDFSIVRSVLPDFIGILEQVQTFPSDPDLFFQWGLHNEAQLGGIEDIDIDAPEAWTLTTGDSNVIVAVLDSGVDRNHPDLQDNIWINTWELYGIPGVDDDFNGFEDDIYGRNFVNNNNNTLDDLGHGTSVAGIIGAKGDNFFEVAGVNWNVQIMPLKVTDADGNVYASAVFQALEYAARNGASIANLSLNLITDDPAQEFDLITMFDWSVGNLLVIAAAGNEGVNVDKDYRFFAFSEINRPQIISVGAITDTGGIASISNSGKDSVDLGAPGVNIYTTNKDGFLEYRNGTSLSAPYTSGVAALIKARFPALGPLSIRDRILNNVDTDPIYDTSFATGGRLNAYKALQ